MVIGSKVSSKRYIWLRVPRTATVTYGKIFFPDGNYEHTHSNYFYERDRYGDLPAFSVVRNPHDRFVSSVKHIYKQQLINGTSGKYKFTLPFTDTKTLYTFFESNLKALRDIDNNVEHKRIFQTEDLSFVKMFFRLQKNFVGYSQVKVFKYEELQEFNYWIQTELGFDTSKVSILNSSSEELSHINFLSDEFKELTYKLFEEDYKFFGYVQH